MKLLYNGRVSILLAELSGREVIEILGIFVGLFLLSTLMADGVEKLKCCV